MSRPRPATSLAPPDPESYAAGAEAMRAAIVAALVARVAAAQAKVDARAAAPERDQAAALAAAAELGTAACALRDAERARLPGASRRRRA